MEEWDAYMEKKIGGLYFIWVEKGQKSQNVGDFGVVNITKEMLE